MFPGIMPVRNVARESLRVFLHGGEVIPLAVREGCKAPLPCRRACVEYDPWAPTYRLNGHNRISEYQASYGLQHAGTI